MSKDQIWLTIFLMGVVTYLPRLFPMLLLSRMALPNWLQLWLKYVPTSIFGALIFSEIFLIDGQLNSSWNNISLWASVAALLVAMKTKSLAGAIATGGIMFWALQTYGL